jgi:catechol 2,3-dioxygenase-like lactoylglutathione lyase family enzyme
MLDHMNLPVSDIAKSRVFFSVALAPLGYKVIYDLGHAVGFGIEYPIFWIERDRGTPPAQKHVAFAAPTRATVKAFYDAAIAAGGRDNGAPGLRPSPYPKDYFAAFVLDPDGNNIEAVCRNPE